MSVSPKRGRQLAAAVVFGTIVVASVLVSPGELFGVVESIAADPYLFGLVVIGLYLLRPLFVLPTTPLAVVVGYGYGVALGVPVALVGVVTTVVPVFLAARWLGAGATETATALRGGWFGALLERTGTTVSRYYETAGPVRGVVVSRLAPIPSDVSTCAAAVSDVRLRELVVGTAIGELPWTIAAVVVGASTATVTTDGLGELGVPLTVGCLLAAMALLAGPVYRLVRSWRRQRTVDS
ncbi:TVP38/TMEM64 family protein [Natronorubrum aibiense]|uniref:TVP38/TMEM64 family protein n=1 Tax=Natronorubrum aibiense TaxID=348826 RepID=A0A5P9P6V0_9EURY|nr:VTT domain-containing protein [Natronorubrum aibiense]QFU83889.1 TVP38/TMEM64 family protein [Natronorubrum aibiense]